MLFMKKFNLELAGMSNTPDEVVHICLNFNDCIMTISSDESKCHPEARYWLSWANIDRLDTYLKLNSLPKINCQEHFTKLVMGRIVQTVTPSGIPF